MLTLTLITGSVAPADEPATAPAAGSTEPVIGNWPAAHSVCRPVPLTAVRPGGFLGEHVTANNQQSIPAGLHCPIPLAFEALGRGEAPQESTRRLATDSDFYKWMEGACYALAEEKEPPAGLREAVDQFVAIFGKLQRDDGYLGTGISPAKPYDEKVRHDLYCAGHFIEAAVAHQRATGKRDMLDMAVKLADFYWRGFQEDNPYYQKLKSEHAELELALLRLHRATGEARFLEFARALIDAQPIGPRIEDIRGGGGSLHAVRLCYLLTAAVELSLQTGDRSYAERAAGVWEEITSSRIYVTGGIGMNESVPAEPFLLPQALLDNPHRDIAETCASVALMMLSWRLHGLDGDPRRFDVIERILYNHYLGAIARDHLANFYYNPLRRVGDMTGRTDHHGPPVQRQRLPAIHTTACCLPNSWRFFGQLPEYLVSRTDDGLRVNLYTEAEIETVLPDGGPVRLKIRTAYPHEGDVVIRVFPAADTEFTLGVRIPAWCRSAAVAVNDEPTAPVGSSGYHLIRRTWRAKDRVRLALPMEPMVLTSRAEVTANAGQVVFARGPVIYCLEKEDAGDIDLTEAVVRLDPTNPSTSARQAWSPKLKMHVLKVMVDHREPASQPALYPEFAPPGLGDPREVTLVPFHFRANRAEDTRWLTWIPWK